MQVNWLLEKDVFDDDEAIGKFVGSIDHHGHLANVVSRETLTRPWEVQKLYPPDACVVLYGSLGAASVIRRTCPWIPGVYCDVPKYACTEYYPHFGKNLLNADYTMLPFGELDRRKDYLLDTYGHHGEIFVRPNSGFKLFGGQILKGDDWEGGLRFIGNYNGCRVEPSALVVVASPKRITAEYRLVVVNGQVVSGARYMIGDEINHGSCGQDIMDYGQSLLSCGYAPEAAWTLDIAIEHSGPQVLEVNAFSTSGLYGAPLEQIVLEVSKAAIAEWEDTR